MSIPNKDELKRLPLLAIVALAARCARRVRPLFQLPDSPDQAVHLRSIDRAIEFTESVARGTESAHANDDEQDATRSAIQSVSFDSPDEGIAREAIRAAAAKVQLAGEAAAKALHAAIGASYVARSPGVDTSHTADAVAGNAAASAKFAAKVISDHDKGVGEAYEAAVSSDYETLLKIGLGQFPDPGQPVDPAEDGPLGPLWPEEEREEEEEEESLEHARDENITLRLVLGQDSPEDIFGEQQDKNKRKTALVLEVPADFESTQSALDWVKAIKALELEALRSGELVRTEGEASSVSYDPWKTLPCLIVHAPALDKSPWSSRQEEERIRDSLAKEGAIVLERNSQKTGGGPRLDELRRMLGKSLQLGSIPENGQMAADDLIASFFRELRPSSKIDKAYGRFPTHIEPLDKNALQQEVEKGFKEYNDYERNPWWTLEY